MVATRRSRRAVTRSNTKRTILSALDENSPIEDDDVSPTNFFKTNVNMNTNVNSSESESPNSLPDLDIFKAESIRVLLSDIQKQIQAKQEILSIKGAEINKRQQEVYFINTMKIEKSVKKMTVREFNAKHMGNGNGNGVEGESECIIDVMKAIMNARISGSGSDNASGSTGANNAGTKKRVRQQQQQQQQHQHQHQHQQYQNQCQYNNLPLETPVRQIRPGIASRTPGTILRTVRKNEAIYSSNGSPINHAEEGDLIATVSKKRRGNGNGSGNGNGNDGTNGNENNGTGMFDISVGGQDGTTISLSDPSAMEHLTSEMRSNAKNQLNVLQDQLSKLLSKLG